MSLFTNSINYIHFVPKFGPHINKQYLFEESNRRWSGLKTYVKNRKPEFINSRFFCITGLDVHDKWQYGNYQQTESSRNLPLPELIYDILQDKVYIFKGQLWTIPLTENLKK